MRSSLGWDESVDLVDDDGFYRAKRFACVRSEEKVERFRRGDEDVAWVAFEAGAIAGAGVAGADADLGEVDGDAFALGQVCDAGERGAEVALDVYREGLEGRDIKDLAAFGGWRLAKHELVETPEEGRQGLAGPGGGEDEGGLAAGDGRPAFALGRRDGLEDSAEPGGGDGVEDSQGVRWFGRLGRLDSGRGGARWHCRVIGCCGPPFPPPC